MSYSGYPANVYLHVTIYEDGDPPRRLAKYIVEHKHEDPLDKTNLIVSEIGDTPEDEAARRESFKSALPLASVCNTDGKIKQLFPTPVQFDLRLTPWLTTGGESRRAYVYVANMARTDIFTEEDHRIVQDKLEKFKSTGIWI